MIATTETINTSTRRRYNMGAYELMQVALLVGLGYIIVIYILL